MRDRLRRGFVLAWMGLGLLGALNHTIVPEAFDDRLDLELPHLAYGHVMFNHNPRVALVFSYARADGVRHELAELSPRPAPGYLRARLAIDALFKPIYLRDLCNRALRSADDEITIYVDDYRIDVDPRRIDRTSVVRCRGRGNAGR